MTRQFEQWLKPEKGDFHDTRGSHDLVYRFDRDIFDPGIGLRKELIHGFGVAAPFYHSEVTAV